MPPYCPFGGRLKAKLPAYWWCPRLANNSRWLGRCRHASLMYVYMYSARGAMRVAG